MISKAKKTFRYPLSGAWEVDQSDGAIVPVLIGNHSQQSRNRFHIAILRCRSDHGEESLLDGHLAYHS